jgi:hypothetical protein
MDLFANAAKLPLMFEQIALEKDRNKLEAQKIKLAEKEAQYMASNFETMQSAKAGALASEKAFRDEQTNRIRLENEELKARLKRQTTAAPTNLVESVLGMTTAAEPSETETAPLADVETIQTGAQAPAVEPTAEEKQLVERAVRTGAYQADFSRVGAFMQPGESDDAAFREEYTKAVSSLLPVGREPTMEDIDEVQKSLPEIRKSLTPTETTIIKPDSKGVPIEIPVITVGKRIIRATGPGRISIKALHENNSGQKKFDETFATRIAGETEEQVAALQQNVNRLMNAADMLVKIEKEGNVFERSRLLPLLPNSVQSLLAPDAVLTRDQVRTAIQQSLRAVLGAQFTQKEGESMMERAFNPLLGPEANMEMIRQAVQVADTALRERADAAEYFRNNGTLFQFRPTAGLLMPDGSPNLARLEMASNQLASLKGQENTAATGGTSTSAPATSEQINAAVAKYRAAAGAKRP